MKTRPSADIRALRDAVAAVVHHNRRLIAEVRSAVPSTRLSRILNCERNDGHRFIEDVATALKRVPRGAPPAQVPLMLLSSSSAALLEALEDFADDVPAALRRPLRHAIGDAGTVEDRCRNFCLGISGASPRISRREQCRRIDLFVRDLKAAFAEINKALVDIEDERGKMEEPPAAPPVQPPVPATKSDLRAAVKTILRGEDVNAVKPGPRLTPAKRRQIEAAKNYRATHCGCTLHNACIRSFVPAKGGYKNAMALYRTMKRNDGDDLSS